MSKKFEYRILNLSEVAKIIKDFPDKKADFLTVLNQFGSEGWQVVHKIKDSSYLLMREK